ncbi:class I SAM-dependent methyltransferase [Actinophytocola oryzae]|uniref:class I SAM-dependent methyltransferase n=1 Tax=Actinophytocola oryzae TaxID=502181 RepID=UPI001FBA2561|nr:methyltransferase domain-containing protein [Actinophytocola oryzae]
MVSLLDLRPTDRVLEVGFGPGIAVGEMARVAGQVYGVDHSSVMLRAARRRNAAAVRAGRVSLFHAPVDRLPGLTGLDVIVSVNSLGFWPEPGERLRELRGLLRDGGRIALASQPRCLGASAETTERAGRELSELLAAAGFVDLRTETLELAPPVACILGTNRL